MVHLPSKMQMLQRFSDKRADAGLLWNRAVCEEHSVMRAT